MDMLVYWSSLLFYAQHVMLDGCLCGLYIYIYIYTYIHIYTTCHYNNKLIMISSIFIKPIRLVNTKEQLVMAKLKKVGQRKKHKLFPLIE